MDAVRRMALAGFLAGVLCTTLGCQNLGSLHPKEVWHNMQPHRLQMLNRGAPAMGSDAYFSVLDAVPSMEQARARKLTAGGRE